MQGGLLGASNKLISLIGSVWLGLGSLRDIVDALNCCIGSSLGFGPEPWSQGGVSQTADTISSTVK